MIYFKFHSGYETGRNLLAKLIEESSSVVKFKDSSLAKIKSGDILVRWGDSSDSEVDQMLLKRGVTILNRASAILTNTNKFKSLGVFKNAGLNTPVVHTDKTKLKKFPVLGRDNHHHGGLDIVIINGNNHGKNNISAIPNKDFYSELIPSKKEYRVHVFNGKVIRVTKKVFRGHDKDNNPVEESGVIRNDTYGWGHSNVSFDNLREEYADAAIEAVKAIGLSFGAVDLLIGNDDRAYVLEVNSSPRLNDIGLDIYAKEILASVKKVSQVFKKTEMAKPTKGRLFIKW